MHGCKLHFLAKKCPEFLEWSKIALNFFYFQAVCFTKSDQNIMICFGKIIDNTIDIGFDILWTMNILALGSSNVQCIRNTKMMPQKLVKRRIFINPDHLADWHNGDTKAGSFYKIVFGNEHIFGCQLWKSSKLFLGLCQNFSWFPITA